MLTILPNIRYFCSSYTMLDERLGDNGEHSFNNVFSFRVNIKKSSNTIFAFTVGQKNIFRKKFLNQHFDFFLLFIYLFRLLFIYSHSRKIFLCTILYTWFTYRSKQYEPITLFPLSFIINNLYTMPVISTNNINAWVYMCIGIDINFVSIRHWLYIMCMCTRRHTHLHTHIN